MGEYGNMINIHELNNLLLDIRWGLHEGIHEHKEKSLMIIVINVVKIDLKMDNSISELISVSLLFTETLTDQ